MNQPYLRRVELLVGPLPEWQGGGDEEQALRIYSTGADYERRISFEVHKHSVTTSSPTRIQVYNLPKKLRDILQESETNLLLRVGWMNSELVDLFTGSLLACTHERQGPDIITTLISLCGWGSISRALSSVTYGEGTLLQDMIFDLASRFPSITVDKHQILVADTRVGSQGLSFCGTVDSALNKLARVHGFSWWVSDGSFFAKDDQKSFVGGEVLISYKGGFLLRAEPMLASPAQKQTGVSIESLLNPHIQPGKLVALESQVNPQLNGGYTVHTLAHRGDTHSDQWESSIQSWVVG
jgi:hypothetical protein